MISAQMDSMAQEALIEKYMFLPNQVNFKICFFSYLKVSTIPQNLESHPKLTTML